MSALQGTRTWFAQREGQITGSRVGAILGVSPFASRSDVMREMVREQLGAVREFVGNVATDWGTEHEDEAIERYEDYSGELVVSTGFHAHPNHARIGVSPDGFVGEGLIEVKCPFGIRYKKVPTFKTVDEVPHYAAQMQLQMAVTGREYTYFVQWTPHAIDVAVVVKDEGWLNGHLHTLNKFIEEFDEIVASEELSAPYLEDAETHRDDGEWLSLEEEYIAAKGSVDAAIEELAMVKEKLVESANGKKTRGDRVLVFPVQKSGSIAYSKAVKTLLPDADLELFRGKPSTTWNVREQA